ncbi:Photosystem II stability/assembly factor HCF136, chloroplastic [Vitis vinifera]|uniref:Photosystem II stability/assembly factor HCF136, chloroplastic n=1 Tax=Vitis vinifera TaxID=29760 RepID=A0A438ECP2_VITVI|nr:Photosystem II stability/assembly factor HCF136, chloroplastic [Vitis vinifera]RVW65210.1 Photosystem II stability/assembly factor HCF136, chloroplastic [Vitis vinifera]
MATLQLSDYCNPVVALKPSLKSFFIKTDHRNCCGASRVRVVPRACLQKPSLTRRHLLAETAAISVAPLILGIEPPAKSEEPLLSEWERVYLPIDPGVVLLDIAFVPDDLSHGFLLGTRQTIMETKDGGNTWVPRSIPSAEDEDFNYRFNSISFKGKEGWIVGKPSILLYTSDAGESWERIPLSAQLPGDIVSFCIEGH